MISSTISGIAFPTCISVNNVICHYSPLFSEPDSTLADGDLVKIDMGAHIDGFIAVVAHTFVLGASADAPVTGKLNVNINLSRAKQDWLYQTQSSFHNRKKS